jgi:gas vesicle protein
MADRDSGASFSIGLLLGVAAGVAVGFLYAPKTGKETRALLKEKAHEAQEKVDELGEKAKEAADEAKKRVEERLHKKEAEG